MKVLVCSDSHGNAQALVRAVEQEQPRQVLFLGDGLSDADKLQRRFPDLVITAVPGNCDWGSLDEPERLLELEGVRILMMHGHTRRVKYDSLAAIYAARELGAQVLLFGHTHVPLVDYDGSLYTMNPGTVGDPRRGTYGILVLEKGTVVDCSTRRLA